ncbi:uncharacterized protein ACJ7VT_015701 [Polymixia lowei]
MSSESPELHAAKAKDLQSTSTLEQFMAKLCLHHQRQIVDALGFLQTEVRAFASSSSSQASNPTSGNQGATCTTATSSLGTPEKSCSEPRLPIASTPKGQEMSLVIPHNFATAKNIPEAAVSLKTSIIAGPVLDLSTPGSGSTKGLVIPIPNTVDAENNRHSEHAPLKMKIMKTSKLADECLKEHQRNMLPRRNARKSTRGHMYVEEMWELKTVRTLAGRNERGNCPNPMPELITLVTPKQMLAKPDGVPPVDMPFAGGCGETISQQMPSEESDDREIPGTGDAVEAAASEIDLIVETSQTDQSQSKEQSAPPSPLIPPSEDREADTNADVVQNSTTISDQTRDSDLSEETVALAPIEAEQETHKPDEVLNESTEQVVAETGMELPGKDTIDETEPQFVSDKVQSSESEQQHEGDTQAVVDTIEEEVEEKREENIKDEQPLETQLEAPKLSDNLGVEEKSSATGPTDEETVKKQEIDTVEPVNSAMVETEDDDDGDDDDDVSTKTLEALLKELPPWRRKRGTVISLPKRLRETKSVIVGYVNGRPISASDRSLRRRSSNSSPAPNKSPVKSSVAKNAHLNTSAENIPLPKHVPEKQLPVKSTENTPVTEQVTEPSPETPASKRPSRSPMKLTKNKSEPRAKKIQKQTTALNIQDTLPAPLPDQPTDVPQSPKSKRPLRSARRKLPGTAISPLPTDSVAISASPRPTTPLSLPSTDDLPPLPVSSSPLPVSSSSLPVSSSPLPVSSSSLPVSSSPLPVSSSPLPISSSPLPVSSSPLPVSSSPLPVSSSPLPVSSSPLPVSSSPLPVSSSPLPVSSSPLPVSTSPLPVSSSPLPVSSSPLPVSSSALPLSSSALPVSSSPPLISSSSSAASEQTQQCTVPESTVEMSAAKSQSADPSEIQETEVGNELQTKQKLRSAKVATEVSNIEKQQVSSERTSPLESQSVASNEMQTQSTPLRSKRILRKEEASEFALQTSEACSLADKPSGGDSSSFAVSDKPVRMPLRSESSKAETSNHSLTQPPPVENMKLALRSQRLATPSTSFLNTARKQKHVVSPIRVKPERIARTPVRSSPLSTSSMLPPSSVTPFIIPRLEPLKKTAHKFLEALNGEDNQQLITNLNIKFDKMQKGWVQMDKEGQPATKYKNKADRQAAIWKSKRRTRKPKSLDHQRYSPVQMLFMKNFDLTSICRWFLESTETKSLVIVKKVNTRLPSETQLCFHSSSGVSGTSQGVFPSLQAERLKKHLKKFAIASPVKSNPKSQKLIAKALEQEANIIKGKEKRELSNATLTLIKPHCSSAEVQAQIGEAQKVAGKSRNPASARILRKYSNIREKMQGQQTNVRLKEAPTKRLKATNVKKLTTPKSASKPNRKATLKGRKVPLPVTKRMKESVAKMGKGKTTPGRKTSIKPTIQERTVKTLSSSRASRDLVRKDADSPQRCSQRLGSPKTLKNNLINTSTSKAESNKKMMEAEKTEVEKPSLAKAGGVKSQTRESSQSRVTESKGVENAVESPQQNIDSKAPISPDQVLTRSQRKMEATLPLSASPNSGSKRASKSITISGSPKSVGRKAQEPTLTRSGTPKSVAKKGLAPSPSRSVTAKFATKRAQEPLESPAKRTRMSHLK